ncbi:hypothetical protein ACF8EF_06215 [Pseudomonas sp. zjy_15]|uniref:hypothetical protein n=1 Tax=unclassified Pseudomonas TaxID=196821 RepID=UPI00370C37E5
MIMLDTPESRLQAAGLTLPSPVFKVIPEDSRDRSFFRESAIVGGRSLSNRAADAHSVEH